MPSRGFDSVSSFESALEQAEELLFDGTECPIERPKDYEEQKVNYSGKKKQHTALALVLSDKKRHIYYVSEFYEGSKVDMGVIKEAFCPDQEWFGQSCLSLDLGFTGIGKVYSIAELNIGHKKPRKSEKNPNPELTKEQKAWNKQVSQKRIYVEHAIGGMKHFRILRNKIRLKCKKLRNKILGLCAGLWNYRLSLKD